MISIGVDLPPYEAEELRRCDYLSSKSKTTVPKGLLEDDDADTLIEGRDNLKDLDYVPSEDDEEPAPKPFIAMKLVPASKRKERPFAPPERHAKKKSGPSSR